jgi:hypothetical protein
MLAGLMSRWTRPRACIGQGVTDLTEQEQGAVRRQRTELAHERLEVAADQQLHDVVERAVLGLAVVEEVDRVRRAEGRSRLCFALEAAHQELRVGRRPGAEQVRAHQLD